MKFAVAGDTERARLRRGLADAAVAEGYAFVSLDAATTRVHLIDQVFFAVAGSLDWSRLAASFTRSVYAEAGFPAPDGNLSIAAVAAHHDVDQRELYRSVRRLLERSVLRDHGLAHELRLALLRLCSAELRAGDVDDEECQAVLDWLRGDLRQVRRVRSSLIFSKVARHNARPLLVSLPHLLTRAGRAGLVLSIDIARVALARRPPSAEREGHYYSKAAALDTYEVLRQLIDATDELVSCLVVVLAPPEFLTDPTRGVPAYTALQMRILDEVRDRRRANPFAALVRPGASR